MKKADLYIRMAADEQADDGVDTFLGQIIIT